jgi:hypothetical protein
MMAGVWKFFNCYFDVFHDNGKQIIGLVAITDKSFNLKYETCMVSYYKAFY